MVLKCAGENSWESLGLQGDQTSQSLRKSVLNIHCKDWCWSFSILATCCKRLTHWKRPWCWERLQVGKGDNRGWDGWMALPMWWTWVWVGSGSWWWTGKPGVLQSMGVTKNQTSLSDWTDWTDQCRRHVFDPWVRQIPWRRRWQPTPVSLPGKPHGQRSLEGYSPWGHKRIRYDLATK